MGIPVGTARLLLEETKRRPFGGSVLELGKSFVFLRLDELVDLAARHGVELAEVEGQTLSHDPDLAAQGCLSDRTFFRLLGFDEVLSSDARRWEGADVVFDLNEPAPAELHERFDAVFEGGTLQHVFDLPRALENVHRVLKPGGRVIHGISPSSNHVDHGFYMFSPTFFFDFYRANGWAIESFYLFDFVSYWARGRMYTGRFRVYRYGPGSLDHLSYGRWGNRQTGIFVVATRGEGATGDVVPQQGLYQGLWQDRGESSPEEPQAGGVAARRPSRALRLWKLVRELIVRWGPKRLPPTVARY